METLILSRYDIQPDIVIPESEFFTLSIENREFLLSVLLQLRNQIDGGKEDDFKLTFNGKALNMEKCVSGIFDFTNIDFNSKRIFFWQTCKNPLQRKGLKRINQL
ncbi:MAG: hypothetical protein LBS21_05480 [Clostridiales bacterium]|jgi:CRISPR type II-A-associated protein Csn2|nr:hypothetical protein [Clostridiales bacterium]